MQTLSYVLESFQPTRITGWARRLDSDEPVLLDLKVNGEVVGTIRADMFRHDLQRIRPDGLFAVALYPFGDSHWECYVPQNAHVELREQVSGLVIGKAIWNGHADKTQTGIRNEAGQRMCLNKGRFVVPLSEQSDDWKHGLLTAALKVADESRAEGFSVCASYGTLLGAVRDGNFIGHDDDVDLMFISTATSMLEAVEDFHRFQEFVKSKGCVVRELTNGQVHVWTGDETPSVDIFLGWFEHERLSLTFTVREGVSRNDVLPLRVVMLNGRALPAPRRPEALLEAIYGPGWKTPDPAFVWRRSKEITEYFAPVHNYNRGANADYWREYYAAKDTVAPPQCPSQFAAFALSIRPAPGVIIDLGCGNGRDALFFASQGVKTIGLDYAGSAISASTSSAKARGLSQRATFHQVDVSDMVQVKEMTELITESRGASPLCVYSRFFFHALNEDAEGAALLLISQLLRKPSDYALLEFRTTKDMARQKVTPDHYRRYIDVDHFLQKAESIYGLKCEYRVEGIGYAVFREDDAHVARLMLVRDSESLVN